MADAVVIDTMQDKIGPGGKIVTVSPDDLSLLRDTLKRIYKDLGTEWTEKAVSTMLFCVSPISDIFEAHFQNGTTIYFKSEFFQRMVPNWTPENQDLLRFEEVKPSATL